MIVTYPERVRLTVNKSKNMKKIFTSILVTVVIFSVSAQEREKRHFENFSEIYVSSIVQVILTPSDTFSVEVEAPLGKLQVVDIKQNGTKLSISTTGNTTWNGENPKVFISLPSIKKIKTSGASAVKSTGLFRAEDLEINASGASAVQVSLNATHLTLLANGASVITLLGYVQNVTIEAGGASVIEAKELNTDNVALDLSGASQTKINVNESVIGDVYGAANLSIEGSPSIKEIRGRDMAYINGRYYYEDIEIKNDVVGDIKYKETIDSTYISVGNKKVIIVDDIDKTRVEVSLKDSTKTHKFLGGFIDIGANGFLTSSQSLSLPPSQNLMELNYSRSREFSMNMMIQGLDFARERFYFTTGLGLNYAGYHFKDRNINISTSNDTTEFYSVLQTYNKYKLRSTYLQVPVMFGVRFGNVKKDYGLQFGVIGGLKMGSIIKEKYVFDGKNIKNKIKDDFNLNPFKATATVRLRFNFFSIYANYALTPLFEKNKAPELYPFSVGLTFGSI